MLLNFWRHFREPYPMHQLWPAVDRGEKCLTRCLPCYLHGDEGVSFKKGGIFIFSFQSAFGTGTSKSAVDSPNNLRAVEEGIRLNFLQTGFQTRMLICACPKECTGKTIVHKVIFIHFWVNLLLVPWCHVNMILHTWTLCRRCTQRTGEYGTRSSRLCPRT